MCNLYSMTRPRDEVLRLFRVTDNRAAAFEPFASMFPGRIAPVVRVSSDGERELVTMSWGFVLPQTGKAPRRVTNFRDDKARTSAFWRESFEQRRCLVPASSFCEPNDGRAQGERATWHWFALKGDKPRPLFAFAGIWRHFKGPLKKDGPIVGLDVYSFLTTTPNTLVATINHERMPVMLRSPEAQELWLHGSPDDAFRLARQFPAEAMHIVAAGPEKEDAGAE